MKYTTSRQVVSFTSKLRASARAAGSGWTNSSGTEGSPLESIRPRIVFSYQDFHFPSVIGVSGTGSNGTFFVLFLRYPLESIKNPKLMKWRMIRALKRCHLYSCFYHSFVRYSLLPARKASSAWVGVSLTRVSANFIHLLRARTGIYLPVEIYRTKFLLISSSSEIAGSSLPLNI